MYNVSFTTKKNGEIVEQGFTTSLSPNIDDSLGHFEDEIGFDGIDEIELKINRLKFTHRPMKTQIGESLIGDFEENTWTFEMPKDFTISAGKFAIVPLDEYNRMKGNNE